VQDAFNSAGSLLFSPLEMTFKDPATGKTFKEWKRYFRAMKRRVPEGMPGSNPGSLSLSPYLEFKGIFGLVDGWE
jgi:hypothetical protein